MDNEDYRKRSKRTDKEQEDEDYQARAERMQRERDIAYSDLSIKDKAKYRNLETQYEVESQEGMASNVSKDEWIKSRMYGLR